MWKSKFYGAFVLNHRVVLHAIACSMAPRHRHPTHWLISTQVLESITNIFFPIGWIWRLALSFVYLFYMLKIREAAAREGGFQDHPVLCGNECCETYWCLPCIACFMMRHDIAAKQPGQNYQGCGNMSGTVYDLPA